MRERSREKVNAPRRTTLAGFFVGAAPPSTALTALARAPPPVRARASRSRRRFSPRVSASPADASSPSPSTSSPRLGSAANAPRSGWRVGARAERLAVLRGELRRGVAARGTAPLTLSHVRMHAAWNACAHAITPTSCPRSMSSQHTKHAATSRPSTRNAQSSSPATHRGSDAIVALDAGRASHRRRAPVGTCAHRGRNRRSRWSETARAFWRSKPSSSKKSSREAVPPRDGPPASRPRRSRAPTRRRRLPQCPSTPPGSNASARVPQRQQCTRNTTGRRINMKTVTVLAAPLAEAAWRRGRGHARVVAKGGRLARAIRGRRVRREEVVLRGVRAGCVERSGGARVRGEGVFRDVPKELSVDVAPHTREPSRLRGAKPETRPARFRR